MRIRKWMPYLDFYLSIPFLTIGTVLFYYTFVNRTYEYLGLYLKIWKWEFRFKCYDPDKRKL